MQHQHRAWFCFNRMHRVRLGRQVMQQVDRIVIDICRVNEIVFGQGSFKAHRHRKQLDDYENCRVIGQKRFYFGDKTNQTTLTS